MKLKNEIICFLSATGQKPYQLADSAGVPRTSVYRFLKGERSLSLETAERIQAIIQPARCQRRKSA